MDRPLRLLARPQGALLASALECEAEVFARHFGNTADELEAEYARYDDQLVFVAVADRDDRVVATGRLTRPGAAGLKTFDDVAQPPWSVDGRRAARLAGVDPDRTWDVTTIANRQTGPLRLLAGAALWHGLLQVGRANGTHAMVALLDDRVREAITRMGMHWEALPGCGSREYLGSPGTTPVCTDFAAFLDGQRRSNPEAYRFVSLGEGLTDVELPALEDFVVPALRARVPDEVDVARDAATALCLAA